MVVELEYIHVTNIFFLCTYMVTCVSRESSFVGLFCVYVSTTMTPITSRPLHKTTVLTHKSSTYTSIPILKRKYWSRVSYVICGGTLLSFKGTLSRRYLREFSLFPTHFGIQKDHRVLQVPSITGRIQ